MRFPKQLKLILKHNINLFRVALSDNLDVSNELKKIGSYLITILESNQEVGTTQL